MCQVPTCHAPFRQDGIWLGTQPDERNMLEQVWKHFVYSGRTYDTVDMSAFAVRQH